MSSYMKDGAILEDLKLIISKEYKELKDVYENIIDLSAEICPEYAELPPFRLL